MFGIEQFADSKAGNSFFSRGPAISPGNNTVGQLVTDSEPPRVLVHDNHIGTAIPVKIAAAEKLGFGFRNERSGNIGPGVI